MAKVVSVDLVDNSAEVLEALNEQAMAWLELIGEDAADTAAQKAPVDTGRLKNSISSAVVESEKAVYIGTNVKYAPYQEFGTSRGIPGKHFLQFGATAHTETYKYLLETYLKG